VHGAAHLLLFDRIAGGDLFLDQAQPQHLGEQLEHGSGTKVEALLAEFAGCRGGGRIHCRESSCIRLML
jgi:hypothetical protein